LPMGSRGVAAGGRGNQPPSSRRVVGWHAQFHEAAPLLGLLSERQVWHLASGICARGASTRERAATPLWLTPHYACKGHAFVFTGSLGRYLPESRLSA